MHRESAERMLELPTPLRHAAALRSIRPNNQRSYPEQNDLYMPFDPLFVFAWVGNGDLFFFPIQAGGIHRDDVFLWDHETDSRVWVPKICSNSSSSGSAV